MRIAIIADPIDNQSAGIHVYTKNMVHSLLAHDKKNEYLIIREKKKDDLPAGARQLVIPNINLPVGFKSLRLFFIIPWLLRKHKVDVAVEPAHFGPFNLPPNIKRVTVIHDLTPIKFPGLHRWHSQILQRIFLKHILKKADIIIANSKNTCKDLHETYPFTEGKTREIYLGKDPDFQPASNLEALKNYGLTKPFFLYVGTIEPRKNLVLLLEAFGQFKKETGSAAQLVLVGGKGWRSEAFFKSLKGHTNKDDIILTGFVPKAHLPVLYSATLAFLYPSLYEGFGIPVLEAMGCGAPCLISNSSSLPEVGGDAVLYADPLNTKEWCEGMKKLGQSPGLRAQLAEKSLIQAAKFSWQDFAGRLTAYLNELK